MLERETVSLTKGSDNRFADWSFVVCHDRSYQKRRWNFHNRCFGIGDFLTATRLRRTATAKTWLRHKRSHKWDPLPLARENNTNKWILRPLRHRVNEKHKPIVRFPMLLPRACSRTETAYFRGINQHVRAPKFHEPARSRELFTSMAGQSTGLGNPSTHGFVSGLLRV